MADDAYAIAAGASLYAGIDDMIVVPLEAQQIVANGAWTWFTDPRAVYHDGATYIGWIDSTGVAGVTKFTHATQTSTSFALATLHADDHANVALHRLPDGRWMAWYSRHNDGSGGRYRISTAADNISAWDAEVLYSATLPYTYSNPHYLSATGKIYNHYRSRPGGASDGNPMNVRAYDVTAGTLDTQRTWITSPTTRPYVKSCNDGIGRIDMLLTDAHPDQMATSVYHCYMQLDGSTERLYTSDGSELTAPILAASATKLYDGSTERAWVLDIRYGPDGHPWALFTRYVSTTDHRYMVSRWTGSAWTTPVQICAAGGYLYSGEPYYSGGACFDGNDPTRVYVSVKVGSYWEIQEYRTADGGATWTKHRDITSGSTVRNCRPWSPRGHDDAIAVLWWRGTYSTYTSYSTAIWGAG